MSDLELLRQAVGNAPRVLIVPHNDPDPDAIASAVALGHLLWIRWGVTSRVAYHGMVGRAENKALVRYLGDPLVLLKEKDFEPATPVVLVDTQPGAGNNVVPPHANVIVVFDHHPRRPASLGVILTDIHPDLGACSTILTEYLQAASINLPPALATALFYGIKSDTLGLSRGASQRDVDAYFYLQPKIDTEALGQIERAQVPPAYFAMLDAALHAARVYDDVIISFVGEASYPDLSAEIADLLLRLHGVQCAICIVVCDSLLNLSVRTRGCENSASDLVHHLVESLGTAGGHGLMAGGQIPLLGRDPRQIALQVAQRALSCLQVRDQVGWPLVEALSPATKG